MNHFVTIAIFQYPHEITVLKSVLDAHNIEYYFANETLTGIVPMYSIALGGIQLKIHQEDTAAVKKILKALQDEKINLHLV
jgi:hypothetical protein